MGRDPLALFRSEGSMVGFFSALGLSRVNSKSMFLLLIVPFYAGESNETSLAELS